MRTPALSIAALSKTFPGTKALTDVQLDVAPGEIHALVGQNGSGKSTLIKVLAGFHHPDHGAIGQVLGHDLRLGDAHAAHQAGLRFVHQDLGLVGALDAVDNIALGHGYQTGPGRRIRWRDQARKTRQAIDGLGYHVDVRRQIHDLPISEQTAIAIARALQDWENVPLLVLDEPTAAMPLPETERFLAIVRRVASRGTAVLYVSHHLDEVLALADRVTILRDGVVVGAAPTTDLSKRDVVEQMTGHRAHNAPDAVPKQALGEVVLQARSLKGQTLHGIDLVVRAGEIVGIAGITGSGRDDVCDLIFGRTRRNGEVTIRGAALPPGRPEAAVARKIGLVPSNRHRDGVILPFSVRENLTLADLSPFWRRMILGRRAERAHARHWVDRLRIKTPSTEAAVESLSGGNQQKVVIGKWLRVKPDLLLLDDPTQGVDVAATTQIHGLIRDAASSGTAVLVASSDENELADLCQRVLVLRHGHVAVELVNGSVTATQIITACLGVDDIPPGDPHAAMATEHPARDGGITA
jgi:ribose transport system ATP-binding protein